MPQEIWLPDYSKDTIQSSAEMAARGGTSPRCEIREAALRVLERMVVPDVLMPGQFNLRLRGENPATGGIKQLMLAVLADAVRCFQAYAGAQNRIKRQIFGEAEWWILDRTSEGPFSFKTVCEALGIDPDRLRSGLYRWRAQQTRGMNPARLMRRPSTRTVQPMVKPKHASAPRTRIRSEGCIG